MLLIRILLLTLRSAAETELGILTIGTFSDVLLTLAYIGA